MAIVLQHKRNKNVVHLSHPKVHISYRQQHSWRAGPVLAELMPVSPGTLHLPRRKVA